MLKSHALPTTRHAYLLIGLLALWGFAIAEADPALDLAAFFVERGEHDAAITEYKRYLFFHPDAPDAPQIRRQIGLAYRELGQWDLAVAWLRRALEGASGGTFQVVARVDLGVTLLASGQPSLALFELLKAESGTSDEAMRRRIRFLRGVAYLMQSQWKQAETTLKPYLVEEADPKAASIIEALRQAANHRDKSPTVAKWLSTLLPGAGQIYAGDWRGGLNALVLNGLLAYVTGSAIRDRHFDDAAFTGLMFLQRYYLGNRYRAAEAARRANEQFRRKTRERIFQLLVHIVNR